jgi:hypothetical protein
VKKVYVKVKKLKKRKKVKKVKKVKMELALLIEKKLKEWIREGLKEESWLLKVLPFDVDRICSSSSSCRGLTYNKGLLTQCRNKKKCEDMYCRGCSVSLIGTVDERKESGLYTYRDRKGHKAQHYLEVLKKMKIRVEDVLEEASRLKIKISSEHLKEKVVSRGRPKKEMLKKEVRQDLFARLYLEEVEYEVVEVVKEVVEEKKYRRLSEEERDNMNGEYELKVEERMKARCKKKVV